MTSVTGGFPGTLPKRMRKITGPTQIQQELRQFKKRHHLLDVRRAELVRRYPDQWVAFTANGTIVAGHTIDDVVEKLESKGLSRKGAAIKFMATTRKRMIL